MHFPSDGYMVHSYSQPAATKKAASGKSGTNKKGDGGQSKAPKPAEQEDVEVQVDMTFLPLYL